MRDHNYFVYIMTNKNKTVLYIGVTGDLQKRIFEHENGIIPGFSKKYNCHYLVYYEHFQNINEAIDREKQLKKWRQEKRNNSLAHLIMIGDSLMRK
ncbi:GIY-YIG nuclease family protein [uncultured Draconibacterium sp.]|uniref:GIY-YIG nuclease family protein n=1 Tax=uncultured Draconibacterium sp. TaxID=1573823 RepID=UPI0029C77479|nr:GIY-YIG nuclease family protein [uncultured Draconibacterium sp.]